MADTEQVIRSSSSSNAITTATTTSTSTPPPPYSPPSHRPENFGAETEEDFDRKEVQGSPVCHRYSSASPHLLKGEARSPKPCEERGGDACYSPAPAPSPVRGLKKEAGEEGTGRDQDGPLDFSVRRRDSASETFTDDSRASSSISPPSYLPPALPRHSPDHPHPHPHPDPRAQRHHSGSSRGSPAHSLPLVGRSPGSSPDLSESAGQPKSASRTAFGGPRSPGNPSLTALGLMAESGTSAMTPAAMAAMLGQNGMLGSLGGLLGGDGRKAHSANGSKMQRPFKAYPKEALQMPLGYLGLPGVNPFPGLEPGLLPNVGLSQEDMMAMYRQQMELLKEREKHAMSMGNVGKARHSSPPSSSASSNGSSGGGGAGHPPSSRPAPSQPDPSPNYFSPSSSKAPATLPHHVTPPTSTPASAPFPPPAAPPLVSSTSSLSGGNGSRKRPRTLPESEKDDAYWERRRKNNDAAKRSRDARRAKEDEIALRAALLEQENLKLRVEVAALKTETARLRCMLYNT